ncbi:hypothetical protein NXG27_03990 [Megasphaera paucivorans]|uniref:Uncharacterized protein n=1 Tax=Megasphaera paucivorans TaxID=349095 RepID=A0A1G9QXA3_9FIRM|nr:hypothetical protein [Megasphaera paucivorans]SDM15491.1 hypothetical protein SAMN05660299_00314 [Megasphaera paucivorans]
MSFASNVNYYVCAFDSTGKRIGCDISSFGSDDGKAADIVTNVKSKFPSAAIVEIVTANIYNQYLAGYVRDMTTGKPIEYVAPEPTAAEKKASQADVVAAKYEPQITELKDALATATLAGDTATVTELQTEYTALMAAYTAELEAINNG